MSRRPREVTVWVLARPDDPGLHLLDPAPAGVQFVIGWEPARFDRAPAPDALLDCWAGPTRLAELLRRAPALGWVHSRSAGLDRVLVSELVAGPAVLTNGRGVFGAALAEFALGALLFFAKDLPRLLAAQRECRWEPFEMRPLAGRTLGIVGHGDIGGEVGRRAHALGMRVLGLRRRPERSQGDPWLEEALGPERLLELMARADDVVLAAPLTPGTRGLVGRQAIAAMKPHAVLVNVGRGPVVDEAALVEALAGGRIGGAALDVFETEPLPPGHPLWTLPNVLVSPHCADNVPGWVDAAMRAFLDNLDRFRHGEPLRHVVEDKSLGY